MDSIVITKDANNPHRVALTVDGALTATFDTYTEALEFAITMVNNWSSPHEHMFITWFNNFTTVAGFAEHYGIPEETADRLITAGRIEHYNRITQGNTE